MTNDNETVVTNTTPDTETVQTTPNNTVVQTPANSEVVQTPPNTVVEQRPATRTYVQSNNPVDNAFAASQLIQTIVWSVVVLVLLGVALWLLHVYTGIF